ncbi:MAG: decarboxylating 6-phosphogluconate dehydrogenase [Deltaproteobacteria bacterium]|nr:decarboxylating 6-phosphogluconate dehydrogenase [Deltaproteobacteria bacterium]
MQVAMIGLGRMGMNMAKRILQGGHEVVAYNRTPSKTEEIVKEGAIGSFSLTELVDKLTAPRVVWLIVIDGGNTYYKDDIRRAEMLAAKAIKFMDVGVSGGIWGLEVGYCMMMGGDQSVYEHLEPIFKTLAPENGFLYCGPTGAGHFVKMVHNGIEYGMMQAYGEGFAIMEGSPYAEFLDYSQVAHLWNQGSVIRSWLLELLESAFGKDERLTEIRGYVEDSGEGRWTVQQAVESGVSAPVIALSLFRRFRSREEDAFEDKVLAALRREFGGHAVVAAKEG